MSFLSIQRLAAACVAALVMSGAALAQQPAQRPPIQTTKVEGTEGVYIFRNGGHQAMFVVTPDGVIATDPVAYGRPTGGQAYVDEIRKVTDKPIRYLVYSHHHYDHIAGGKAFKDAGATVIAHWKAKQRLEALADPHTVLPDEAVPDAGRTLTLGGTTLELSYLGLNHRESTLVMRLPKERIVFIVDTIPVGTMPGRGMIDFHPLETEAFVERVLALDWDRLIPGHPGPGDRLGTKKEAADQLQLPELSHSRSGTERQRLPKPAVRAPPERVTGVLWKLPNVSDQSGERPAAASRTANSRDRPEAVSRRRQKQGIPRAWGLPTVPSFCVKCPWHHQGRGVRAREPANGPPGHRTTPGSAGAKDQVLPAGASSALQ